MTGPRPVLDSGLGAGQGIWETTETPILKVGTRGSLEDGRVFYYARSIASSIPRGRIIQSEIASAQNEDLAVNTAALGDTSLTITFGTNTDDANAFQGGYVCVQDLTGEGITYTIKSHPAITSGGSIVVQLEDPIYLGFDGATTVCVMKNMWADVLQAAADTIAPLAGISQVSVLSGATNPQYVWCQTWGVSCAWQEQESTAGAPVGHSPTAGQVGYAPGPRPDIAGIQLFTGVSTEYQPIFLKVSQ